MKSRPRVLAALNHQEADHLPLDIGGTDPDVGIDTLNPQFTAAGMELGSLKQELGADL
jgi:hypothetical protein